MIVTRMLFALCLIHISRFSLCADQTVEQVVEKPAFSNISAVREQIKQWYLQTKISLMKLVDRIDPKTKLFFQTHGKKIAIGSGLCLLLYIAVRIRTFLVNKAQKDRVQELINEIIEQGTSSTEILSEIARAAETRRITVEHLFAEYGYTLDQFKDEPHIAQSIQNALSMMERTIAETNRTKNQLDTIEDSVKKGSDFTITENIIESQLPDDIESAKKLVIKISSNTDQLEQQKNLIEQFGVQCKAATDNLQQVLVILTKEQEKGDIT